MKPKEFTWEQWFDQDPIVVKKNSDGSEYIPIGIREQELDNLDNWGTYDEKFETFMIGKETFVSTSLNLTITYGDKTRNFVGGWTLKVDLKDLNQEYRSTLISGALASASIKIGKRFGRGLNGRLDKGETAIPEIQLNDVRELEKLEDAFELKKDLLSDTDRYFSERVIKNKEKSSYAKLLKLLESK